MPTVPTGQKSSLDPTLGSMSIAGLPGWNALALRGGAVDEEVPDLQWPQSIRTYRKMLTNSQVSSLRQSVRLPLGQMEVYVDPLDSDVDVATNLATDLAVPFGDAESPPARRRGFSMRRHIVRALDALDYGHALFETVGEVKDGRWRLKDLATIPAKTIQEWYVNPDGSFSEVSQGAPVGGGEIRIKADRLLVYSWGGEAGDPRGESMLRPLYAHFLCLDMLMRIDSISHERNGMGVPVGTMPEDTSTMARDEMEALLSQLAAGEDMNLVTPYGSKVALMGVSGATTDKVASMKWHQESMARVYLAMILQLGQTETGSRALGTSFEELLNLFHEAVMDWICEALTVQVSEPYFDRNVEVGAPAAVVRWRRREDSEPVEDEPAEDASAPSFVGQFATSPPVTLPNGQTVRRQLYDHEDPQAFATIADDMASYGTTLEGLLRSHRQTFSLALGNYLRGLSDGNGVNHVSVGTTLAEFALEWSKNAGVDDLAQAIEAASSRGAAQVVTEAMRAGVALSVVDSPLDGFPEAQDLVRRVASQAAEAASTAIRTKLPPVTTGAAAATTAEAMIAELTDAAITRSAAGATARALHAGRVAELATAPVRELYASELLDLNTCGPCRGRDGAVYDSMDAALQDYPAGGYFECDGFDGCRGTLVATYETEQEVVAP